MAKVPEGVDLLLTHGPLSNSYISDVKPRLHVSGHIHGRYGVRVGEHTTSVNAALVDGRYALTHAPVVVDLRVN